MYSNSVIEELAGDAAGEVAFEVGWVVSLHLQRTIVLIACSDPFDRGCRPLLPMPVR
jgi:hypothetical protein